MFLNISPINIGVVILVFVVSILLFLFAPSSKNYYNKNVFPILEYIHENNRSVFNSDLDIIKNDDDWILWPDSTNIINNYLIYPIFIFGVFSEKRKLKCYKSLSLITNIPDIITFAYLKISRNSSIKKNKRWAEVSNNTLCCLLILEAPFVTKKDDCCIWVDGETKHLTSDRLIIYDSSKEHSIINNSDHPIYILMLDIKKPLKYKLGISTNTFDKEIYDFIKKILNENNI